VQYLMKFTMSRISTTMDLYSLFGIEYLELISPQKML